MRCCSCCSRCSRRSSCLATWSRNEIPLLSSSESKKRSRHWLIRDCCLLATDKCCSSGDKSIQSLPNSLRKSMASSSFIFITDLAVSNSFFCPNEGIRSEEHTSELQSRPHLVCRL